MCSPPIKSRAVSPCKKRQSITRASSSAFIAKPENGFMLSRPGRLFISQSTNAPLPARPMLPVPMPPSGNDIFCV